MSSKLDLPLPVHRGLFYGGSWHSALSGATETIVNPATAEDICEVAWAGAADVDSAVHSAYKAWAQWRDRAPSDRAQLLRRFAAALRHHGKELALLDSAATGNPVREMGRDAEYAAATIDYFSGLSMEVKGTTVPLGAGQLDYTVREPLGVVARIVAYNHPLMFAAMKSGAPLAAGNTYIVKMPDQAPLSGLLLAEIASEIFPPGVFNVLTGGRECGEALVRHPLVAKVALIGSVATGKAILRAAADSMKPAAMELGGKGALIAFPDSDPAAVAAGVVRGMNFSWCGQSCSSLPRAFLHDKLHDEVLQQIVAACRAIKPGIPTLESTQMGCLINRAQHQKVLNYIQFGKDDGARLVTGGGPPNDPALRNGFFIEPTVFADVQPHMRIATDEIFGPVLSVFRWSDEEELFHAVNSVRYGLTAAVWTRDLSSAHRAAARIEAGHIWINSSSSIPLGIPLGGYKESGLGREGSLEEILDYTQIKNVHVTLERSPP